MLKCFKKINKKDTGVFAAGLLICVFFCLGVFFCFVWGVFCVVGCVFVGF